MTPEPDKTVLKAFMGIYKRVLRNHITLDEIILAYPSLKDKTLSIPSALTDEERRVFLDLPDVDMETVNIRAVTALSRAALIEKAVKDPISLTQEEIILLKNRFWTPGTEAECEVIWEHRCETEEIIMGEEGAVFEAIQKTAFLPNELEAIHAAMIESCDRPARARKIQDKAIAEAALSDAPEWIHRLYKEGKQLWGSWIQKLWTILYAFGKGFVKYALRYNGSKNIIDAKWRMISFNAPGSVETPHICETETALKASEESSQQDSIVLRSAFHEILQNPLQYEQRADVAPITPLGELRQFDNYKDGLAASGILTNTFLVFDRTCMASVLESGRSIESMRIRAFEADYPVPGKTYAEGYQGYTWVRLDQLVYNFYELRLTQADKVGMDKIWQAAQRSRNAAFVSMDIVEAGNWTPSNPISGFTPDSILGQRLYAKK
ncbi:hypothetical protein BCON_0002g00130 [Botryotinia convoluta]|uniref:Uncharacterized protein n=1 Tax=Botryotinia convoluta TaxID=54673 RepID=A0A4Z1IVL1_9HELO|nr:hypothetical protein BCON_0002g00130 [Botryotinia convoluta]